MKNLIIIALLMCSSVSFGQEDFVTMTTLDKNDNPIKDQTLYGIEMNFYYITQNTEWEADDELVLEFTGGGREPRTSKYNVQSVDTVDNVLILDLTESKMKTVELFLSPKEDGYYTLDMVASIEENGKTVLFTGPSLNLFQLAGFRNYKN